MNLAKNIRFFGLALLATTMTLTYTGCKKDGCTNVDANNYDEKADNDDGSCTYDSEKFIGVYTTTSPCVTGSTWNTTISTSSTSKKKVVVTNIGGLGSSASLTADIEGSTIKINTQNVTDVDGDSWSVSSTTGTLAGTSINLTVTYTFGTNTLTCSETWNKQ